MAQAAGSGDSAPGQVVAAAVVLAQQDGGQSEATPGGSRGTGLLADSSLRPATTVPGHALPNASGVPVFLQSLSAGAPEVIDATTTDVDSEVRTPADAHVAHQIVRAVSLAWRGDVGEASVRLSPEHLGEVTVALRVERGMVSAVLSADTAAAREWITAHEDDLRQGLAGQGLQLESLVVTSDGSPQRRQDQGQRPPRSARRAATDGPRFEVRA